jgi:hypothetical protein
VLVTTTIRDDRLEAELAQLRDALRKVEGPAPNEEALRVGFRERMRQRADAAAAADTGWRVQVAAAAVVVLAVGAVIGTVLWRTGDSMPAAPAAAEANGAIPVQITAFQPLSSSPGLSPALEYSVVRVRIPLSAFALVPGTEQDGTIEAELLVGEDGLARAIRFNETDTMLVSVNGR